MRGIKDSSINYNDVFHYLRTTKENDGDDSGYLFLLSDTKNSEFYENHEYVLVLDPGLDASFKAIFLNNSARFENFLNSIVFKAK